MLITTTTTTLFLAAGAAASHLQLSLSRPQQTHDAAALRHKREVDANLERPLDLYQWFYPYAVDVTVGTPGQEQSLALTFSYSTSFVLNRTACSPPDEENSYYYRSCESGAYDASDSTSYVRDTIELDEYDAYWQDGMEFYEVYGSRLAKGSLMNETVHVGDAEVDAVHLGLVNDTILNTGFMALGWTTDTEEGSFLNQMTEQGVIGSRAFSLWADDQGGNVTGSILFGAVDKSKYDGKLQRLQASAYRDGVFANAPGYAVNVTGAESDNGTALMRNVPNFYASVSPTTMITNLPLELAEPIWEMANATYRSYWDARAVDCNATESINGTFTLELGGAGGYRLEVDLRDLVLSPDVMWDTDFSYFDDEEDSTTWCYFGVQSTSYTQEFNHDSIEPWVIGNMALQNTYMVFDAENLEVGLAPLKSDLSGVSDIESFSHSGETMPDSEFVGYKECFGIWGCDDGSDDGDNDGYDDSDDYPDYYYDYEREWRRQAGIIIGSVFGVVAAIVLGLSIWAILRCRRIRKAEAEAASKERGVFDFPGGPVMGGVPGAVPIMPQPAYTVQRMPVVPEGGLPQDALRQTADSSLTAEDSPVRPVSPMSTPRTPEPTLAREPPATTANQGER